MPLDYLIFDASRCGFPPPRVPLLPTFGLDLLSPKPAFGAATHAASHFRHFARGRYALHEAYRLSGVSGDGALLVPAYHCRTMIDPALALGADVHLYSLNADLSPDLESLDDVIGTTPIPIKAILAVHFFGIPQSFSTLSAWCAKHGVTLIEDCSHALFCERFRAPNVGVHGEFVISSPYKFLPTPDGGLLYAQDESGLSGSITANPPMVEELRGIDRTLAHAWRYRHRRGALDLAIIPDEVAACGARGSTDTMEYRQTSGCSADYQAASEGVASLRLSRLVWRLADIETIIRRRREYYLRWVEALAATPLCRPLFPNLPDDCVPYMFPLRIDRPEPCFRQLKMLGLPIWRWDSLALSNCAIARDYRLRLLHLPCHQSLTDSEMDWMATMIDAIMRGALREAA